MWANVGIGKAASDPDLQFFGDGILHPTVAALPGIQANPVHRTLTLNYDFDNDSRSVDPQLLFLRPIFLRNIIAGHQLVSPD